MSHDNDRAHSSHDKIVRMANQIGTFFESKENRTEGVHGVADHINKFWEPRMRRHFFEIVDGGGDGLKPIVREAADQIRRPAAPITPEQKHEAEEDVSG